MRQTHILKEYAGTLPQKPGVYIFRDKNNKPLYVGKSKSLKNRVQSYFAVHDNSKTAQMVEIAQKISYIVVQSELEALLLEARLVKKFMPKYNSELKDDKSPLYIVITKEEFPRVLTLRKTQLNLYKSKMLYGPFIDGTSAKKVLRILRRIFPFSQHKLAKRACIYKQIGLCNPCPSEISQITDPLIRKQERRMYLNSIRGLSRVLSGKLSSAQKEMTKQMLEYSKNEDYEAAKDLREKLSMFERVTRPTIVEIDEYVKNPRFIEDIREKELDSLKNLIDKYLPLPKLSRIECFDIAHIAGSYPTASMVTFIDGEPDKNFYRHFRVSKLAKNNDYDSMKLVLARRIKHKEWGLPDLLIVDGGKGQVTSALEAISGVVPVVGIAKKFEILIIKTDTGFEEIELEKEALHLVQRLRDEAHRFARRYHHLLIKKALTSK